MDRGAYEPITSESENESRAKRPELVFSSPPPNGDYRKLRSNTGSSFHHSSCEVSPVTILSSEQPKLLQPVRRRDYYSESEIDTRYQNNVDWDTTTTTHWLNKHQEDEENNGEEDISDDYTRQVTCYSDKTLEQGPWSSYQNSTLGSLRPPSSCRFCCDADCGGCRYMVGFAKTRLSSGGVQLKHWLSLPNVNRVNRAVSVMDPEMGTDTAHSKKFTRAQKQTLVCIGLVNFASFLAMSIIAPFFPREAAKKGMREAVSGFVFSVYAFVMMIASPIFGKIMPHTGTNFMYLSGILVSGCSNMLFGVLDRVDSDIAFSVLCFVVRSFEALGAAAFSTASYTIILEMFPDDISTVFGLIETSVGVGMSIGPAVGGGLYSIGGYGLPFFVLGAIVLINIPLSWCFLANPNVLSNKYSKASYKTLLSNPLVIMVSVVVVVASQALGFIDPTLEPHLRQYNLGPEIVGLLFLVMAVAYAIFSPAVGFIIGKWETKYPMMLFGLLLMSIALLLLGPSPFLPFTGGELWLNIVAIVLLGISFSCAFIPTFEAMLIACIDGGMGDNMGTYCLLSGFWNSMTSLGEVAGPALGGLLSDFLDFPLASTAMAVFPLASSFLVLITWYYAEKKKKNQKKSAKTAVKATKLDEDEKRLNDNSTKTIENSVLQDDTILPVDLEIYYQSNNGNNNNCKIICT